MPRYRLDIEYDGSPYAGWQRQDGPRSVQAALEQAVAAFCGEAATLRGAGRTDAGVHALGQAAHLDLAREWPADTVRDGLAAFIERTGANELIITAQIFDHEARKRSYTIVAEQHAALAGREAA